MFQANDWTDEEEQGILNDVIWPLLQPEANEDSSSVKKPVQGEPEQAPEQQLQRTCYLSKIVTLFNFWITTERYTHWFFLNNAKSETVLDWVKTLFTATSVAEDFRRKLLTCICKFVLVNHEGKKERLSDAFIAAILMQFESWLQSKGKSKGGGFADLSVRLSALSIVVGISSRGIQINEKIFFDNVIAYAARGQGDVQTNAIAALNRYYFLFFFKFVVSIF